MKITKDQAYLVLIMFKAQNYDRLVSDFVEFVLDKPELKVGDLNLIDEWGTLWLDSSRGWAFRLCYTKEDFDMGRITYDAQTGYDETNFNFFDYISFKDKL